MIRMTGIFLIFAAVAAVTWATLPHVVGGVALDMLLIYLGFAFCTAVMALLAAAFRRGRPTTRARRAPRGPG